MVMADEKEYEEMSGSIVDQYVGRECLISKSF